MIVDVDTGAARQVASTDGPLYIGRARWAPDGKRLVVDLARWSDTTTASELTGSAIGIVDLRDAKPTVRRLTDWNMWATYPDWHGSKDLIVFATRPWSDLDTGPSNLYTIRSDASHITAITHFAEGETRAAQPSWTPDGVEIIFTAVEGDGFGLPTFAIINSDGSGLRRATGAVPVSGGHASLRPTR